MSAFDTLARIAADPASPLEPERTPVREAVHRIEARTGLDLAGPVTGLRPDLRKAVLGLARQLLKLNRKD